MTVRLSWPPYFLYVLDLTMCLSIRFLACSSPLSIYLFPSLTLKSRGPFFSSLFCLYRHTVFDKGFERQSRETEYTPSLSPQLFFIWCFKCKACLTSHHIQATAFLSFRERSVPFIVVVFTERKVLCKKPYLTSTPTVFFVARTLFLRLFLLFLLNHRLYQPEDTRKRGLLSASSSLSSS